MEFVTYRPGFSLRDVKLKAYKRAMQDMTNLLLILLFASRKSTEKDIKTFNRMLKTVKRACVSRYRKEIK